ncbi:hypothetical protein JJV70_18000 [Streptomyces sp. JJ66]|nr:hypothetical protein [Streptomyces sp. JJ66]
MALGFIGIDSGTAQGNCPAVWIDDEKKEVLFQGWKADDETKAVCVTDSPQAESEGIVRLPYRMVELIRRVRDEAEGS